MYKLLKQDGKAKRGELHTVHGVIQTPVFMNVGTVAAIKGAVSTMDLQEIGTQVELSNTYHLHVRPGDQIVKKMGGLHKFMVWDKPILTDSGGFQVFSLSSLRKIKEEGVYFSSHIDGRKIFMGPEESMQIQSNLASTIAMAFDECPSSVADRSYVQASVERTTRWLKRCKEEMARLNSLPDTINKHQMLFGINQGAVYEDIRIEHAKEIARLDLDGYAVGGLAVGETHEEMYRILDAVVPFLPLEKPTYLMGVGTPANILEAVDRGVDFFDCVYPSRNGRHGHVYTGRGKLNLFNAKYETDPRPIEEGCQCPACRNYSRAYIRHLLQSNLASTIAMAFDECPSSVADRSYVQASVERTTRWLKRCKEEMARLNSLPDTINKHQMLFGINQGAVYEDIRIEHAKEIARLDLDGYAVGGLAVGETHEEMYRILDAVVPFLPLEKPTYLMGVGTPANILEAVDRGVDFFDCVYPSRNGRHGHVYTGRGKLNLFNAKYETDPRPIEEGCQCPACRNYSRAYIRHLLKAKEMLGMRLCVLHNLYFYNHMMEEIRTAIDENRYQEYKKAKLAGLEEENIKK